MSAEGLGATGFLARFLFALLLVFATWNPSGYSWYHWASPTFPSIKAVHALCGVVLLIGWVVYFRATLRSLGLIGVVLAAAFFAALVWVAVDLGWLDTHRPDALAWIGLTTGAAILAAGMSWSHVRRRLTGQADVDDVDEN